MESKSVRIGGAHFRIAGRSGDSYFDHLGEGNDNAFLARVTGMLAPGPVIFDVGANMGVTTAIFAGTAERPTICSFEPSPEAFPYLVETVRLNGFACCTPLNLALGARSGEVSFLHNTGSSGASHMVTEKTLHGGNTVVSVSTVDAQIAERSITRLDLIKIDVEGFEVDVLNGAEKTIETLRPKVFLEFNSFTMMAFRDLYPREFLRQLIGRFPFVYRYMDGNIVRVQNHVDQLNFIHDNLIHKGCVDDLLCCWSEIAENPRHSAV